MSRPTTSTGLKKDFESRKSFFANRSSAIFPLHLRSGTDLLLVFCNYWKIKSGISDLACNVRVYSNEGELALIDSFEVRDDHYEYSVARRVAQPFDGMVEFEFVSSKNLRFPFPGVTAFFKSATGAHSSVHSSGRVKNTDESQSLKKSSESNWFFKYTPDTVCPFIHLFNGPKAKETRECQIEIFNKNGKKIASASAAFPENAFASKMILLKDLFKPQELSESSYGVVNFDCGSIFPRLVVGNYHFSDYHLEATHTFSFQSSSDFLDNQTENKELSRLAFISPLSHEELDLKLISFPTNDEAIVRGKISYVNSESGRLVPSNDLLEWDTGSKNGKLLTYSLPENVNAALIEFNKGPIPARLNTSFLYSVKGSNSPYSAEVATGAKSYVYPPKQSHWGAGMLSQDFDTVLLLRNVSHNSAHKTPSSVEVTVFLNGVRKIFKTEVLEDGYKSVSFKKELNLTDAEISQAKYLSWFAKSELPTVDIYWVSYSRDGKICGDHAF